MKYIHLEQALFQNLFEEFICKAAKTLKEAAELIEAGFEYVTDMDNCKLFKKKEDNARVIVPQGRGPVKWGRRLAWATPKVETSPTLPLFSCWCMALENQRRHIQKRNKTETALHTPNKQGLCLHHNGGQSNPPFSSPNNEKLHSRGFEKRQ